MEITLFDAVGRPVAYVVDDGSIYLWSGHAVCYLQDDLIFGWNGRHLGWYRNGIIYDQTGRQVGFTRQTCPCATMVEPVKMVKLVRLVRLVKQIPSIRPVFMLSASNLNLDLFLRGGQI